MGWLKRFLGADEQARSEEFAYAVGIAEPGDDHIELDVVGEASYQDALERIAGKKEVDGKEHRVGVTLRCEPSNEYDPNAVRVEAMGQLVGYLPRALAARAAPGILRARGAVEGQGVIVGGWSRSSQDEGHYGIRVWLTAEDARRVGVDAPTRSTRGPRADDPAVYPSVEVPPLPPVAANEVRLSPREGDFNADFSTVTVTCEEHYQAQIETTKPWPDWSQKWWPFLATLELGNGNPHAKKPGPTIAVKAGGGVIGYLTPAMTERHAPVVRKANEAGKVATIRAHVAEGAKGGATIWRVKLTMADK